MEIGKPEHEGIIIIEPIPTTVPMREPSPEPVREPELEPAGVPA